MQKSYKVANINKMELKGTYSKYIFKFVLVWVTINLVSLIGDVPKAKVDKVFLSLFLIKFVLKDLSVEVTSSHVLHVTLSCIKQWTKVAAIKITDKWKNKFYNV